ncbi:hypothetical protein [Labrenzia sp. PHM005]|uniref:hypothetical protein n=1 Tax=Labrenzia sp. PHM005 TaxID=2590016 RepID=UPI0011406DC1|nr:hypothetical protein [Labrenzia sp. PHM005]QDG77251.1 hypothetical protein FJ695_15980 [Labrenzia sp. PHM005]
MFAVNCSREKLILRSINRLPQLGLAAAAVILFWGAITVEAADLVGRMGMAATGAGFLAIGWAFFPKQTITFDRAAGTVVNERQRLGRTDRQTVQLTAIKRAHVERNTSDGSPTERLALLTDTANIPLETAFGPSSREDLAKRINDWLTK